MRLYITILHWPCSSFLIVLVAKALATSYDIIFNSLNCTPTCSVAMLVLAKFIVFVAVASRGEDVMPDEICRRFNGKQQYRRRSGRSVQLPDWFMIRHSFSRHACTYTYVLHLTKYIRRKFHSAIFGSILQFFTGPVLPF